MGPEVAEAGGREERVAAGVGGDVAVGVALGPERLALPEQARRPSRAAGDELVDVDAGPDAGQGRPSRGLLGQQRLGQDEVHADG